MLGALLAGAAILWLGRDGSFFHDDLWYLCGRRLGDVASWFRPHNEHWVTLHVVAYTGLAALFGETYLPFQIGVLTAHLAAVAGLFALVDRRVGRVPATAAAAVLLVFGSGFSAIYWDFEVGYTGAIGLGLWALAALPERRWLAALLLLAGVATAGSALPFVAVAVILTALERGPRSAIPLLLPGAAYAIFAALQVHAVRGSFSIVDAPPFFLAAIVAGLGATVGIGLPGIVGALAAIGRAGPRRPTALFFSGLMGLLTLGGLLALTRNGFSTPDAPTYLYAMAPFVLMMGADMFGRARKPRLALPTLVLAVGVNAALLIWNGLGWASYVAADVAAGGNVIPPGVCY